MSLSAVLSAVAPGSPEEALARRIGGGEWLESLPEGLATEVGERGARLSMGQRQLVSLMRVLVQKPAIFILDEATANIDPFTEAQIQNFDLGRYDAALLLRRLQREPRLLHPVRENIKLVLQSHFLRLQLLKPCFVACNLFLQIVRHRLPISHLLLKIFHLLNDCRATITTFMN